MRPTCYSKGTHMVWLLFEKVTQDMRLALSDRSEQLSISLARVSTLQGSHRADSPIYEVSPRAFRSVRFTDLSTDESLINRPLDERTLGQQSEQSP